ncbi:MAG: hypothetical protein PHU85_07210 [Phycisphaerae bacterium]|nr:hypothetical protein [Phycisphaerae bacterium]
MATFSEDAKALSVMLDAVANQAEGQDGLAYESGACRAMVEQIGKVMVHIGKMAVASIVVLLALSFASPADAGPIRLVGRGVARVGKVVKPVGKVLKPVGKVAKAVLPPYKR